MLSHGAGTAWTAECQDALPFLFLSQVMEVRFISGKRYCLYCTVDASRHIDSLTNWEVDGCSTPKSSCVSLESQPFLPPSAPESAFFVITPWSAIDPAPEARCSQCPGAACSHRPQTHGNSFQTGPRAAAAATSVGTRRRWWHLPSLSLCVTPRVKQPGGIR